MAFLRYSINREELPEKPLMSTDKWKVIATSIIPMELFKKNPFIRITNSKEPLRSTIIPEPFSKFRITKTVCPSIIRKPMTKTEI
jgi:hypothetical protein